jgi:hypothetical protein
MRFLYSLVSSFVLWILPLVIVFYSLVWGVSNPDVYLQAFERNDFYEQISSLAKENSNLENFEASDGVVGLVIATIIRDFSPADWQDLVEGNVRVITEWLSGEEENLVLYIPTDKLEASLASSLNQSVREIVGDNPDNVPICSEAQVEEIQRQGGFAVDEEFCLPPQVAQGGQNFSDFLQAQNNQVLEKLFQNNYLSLQRNRYNPETINLPNELQSFINGPLNYLRDLLLTARALTPLALIVSLGLIALYVLLAKLSKKEVIAELAKFARSLGFSLLITSAIVILILGGFYYLNATLLSLVSPIFSLGAVSNLVLWVVLHLAFNLVAPAVWLGLASLVAWVGLRVLSGLKRKEFQAKNDRLMSHEPNYERAQTFDSQFRQAVHPPQTPAPTTPAYVPPVSPQTIPQTNPQPNQSNYDQQLSPTSGQTATDFGEPSGNPEPNQVNFETADNHPSTAQPGFPPEYFQEQAPNSNQRQSGGEPNQFDEGQNLPKQANQPQQPWPNQPNPFNQSSKENLDQNSPDNQPDPNNQEPKPPSRRIQL